MEPSNASPPPNRLSWKDFEREAKAFFDQHFSIRLLEHMPIPLPSGEIHKFDLASTDEAIAIECKSYTWTKSGNYPNAKIAEAQRTAELLRKCKAKRKILAFQDDLFAGKSLVEVFLRRNRLLLNDLEIWKFANGSFEKVADYSRQDSPSIKTSATALEIVFNEQTKPYCEEQPRVVTGRIVTERRYRVGIRNSGPVSVHRARLILENCEPDQSPGIHLGHTFQMMGDINRSSEFSVPPGDVPTVFLDVIYDEFANGQLHGNAFGLCYSAPVLHYAIPRGRYVLTLRLDGAESQTRKRFVVSQDPQSGVLMMREDT